MTGRGGIVVMFAAAVLGDAAGGLTGGALVAGLVFVAGCGAAALLTRRPDLLTIAVSPPAVFLAATVLWVLCTETGGGDVLVSVLLGLVTRLGAGAPWLLAGTVLVVAVTAPRGLFAQARELRERLSGLRLFAEEENQNPVRWDEAAPREGRRLPHHGDVD
ncbi:hypothetical protein K1Y72_03900 [Actinomadura sp. PM05-2]|uniref:DUF6542 domain-containing protein n=1 Tax=Actinomadura parmotrematis TaxID=2864039 RepID=A0ABS7FM95_9ACTN|nr:hypothetical protein [Actinomadura parmotrematis]